MKMKYVFAKAKEHKTKILIGTAAVVGAAVALVLLKPKQTEDELEVELVDECDDCCEDSYLELEESNEETNEE